MDTHVLDTIDAEMIGTRLADARRARRFTQQQAADAIDVARTTIVAMEKGDRRPRAAELVKLARFYGRAVADFVRAADESDALDFVLHFRAMPGNADGANTKRDRDIEHFQQLCRWYVELERLLNAPLPRRYPPPYDISGSPIDAAAVEIASTERNRLGLGDGPVGDLWGLLGSDVGLRVFAFPMADGHLAGLFMYSESLGGCIAVNANHPEERRRLTAAHEYAHFLTDRFKPDLTVLTTAKRKPEHERFADAFARNFLMPAIGLQRRFEAIRRSAAKPITPADILALCDHYRVSFQAMTWRLEELQLLPSGTSARLRDLGFKPIEAAKLIGLTPSAEAPPRLPVRYEALAVQAFQAGKLSEGQLAERLMTDRVDARARVEALTTEPEASDDGDWRQVSLNLSAALIAS